MISIDYLKLLLALLVVLNHSNGVILLDFNIQLINELFSSLAVPLFVIISSYFFAKKYKQNHSSNYLRNTIIRLLILLLVFQSIWLLIYPISIQVNLISSDNRFLYMINVLYCYFVTGYYQFWYINAYIIAIIIYALALKNNKEKWFTFGSIVSFVIIMANQMYNMTIFNPLINFLSYFFPEISQSFLAILIFVCIGAQFDRIQEIFKKYTLSIYGCIVLYVIELVIFYLSQHGSVYLWLTSPLICSVIFYITLNLKLKSKSQLGLKIRHYSTLLYVIHYQLIQVMMNRIDDPYSLNRLYYFVLFWIILLVITYLLEFGLSKLSKRYKFLSYLY